MFRGSFILIFIFAYLFNFVYLLCSPPDPDPQSCFNQEEFNDAISNSTEQVKIMESILESGYNLSGFLLTSKDAANDHFSTHDIDREAMNDNFVVTVVNGALMFLKSRNNLTKSQLRTCILRENITTKAICEPRVVSCDPAKTRLYFINVKEN